MSRNDRKRLFDVAIIVAVLGFSGFASRFFPNDAVFNVMFLIQSGLVIAVIGIAWALHRLERFFDE